MKTRRFDFNYRSLSATTYIEVIGSIPNKQRYDVSVGAYEPDYTIAGSYLTLQPHVSVSDADGIIRGGDVTSSSALTNIVWTEILNNGNTTTTTTISSQNTNYIITTSGTNKGRIQMKRNVPSGGRITLRFTADYLDSRTSEVLKIDCSMPVDCSQESSVYMLHLDKPDTNMWNPFRDVETMTFNASLTGGGGEVETANRTIVWEKQRSNDTWSEIGDEEQDDFGWSVTENDTRFVQDMKYIGEHVNMRVRVDTLNGSTVTGGELTHYFSITRRLPNYQYDYTDVPDNIEPGVASVRPKAVVIDQNGTVPNFAEHLNVKWYTGAGVQSGSPSMALVASGTNPVISTSKINAHGMVLGLDVSDKGNFKKMVNNGNLIVQEINGETKIIICKTTR